jgi:hypothetical protein
MTVWQPVMPAYVTLDDLTITHQHGMLTSFIAKNRVPKACAYTYQSFPNSSREAMPSAFPDGLSELNGGLQIFKPTRAKYERILNVLNTSAPGDFLFADQSLLSKTFHGEWMPLYALCKFLLK